MILISHPLVPNSNVLPIIKDSEQGYDAQFVKVKNKIQAVLANANGVKFIVCDNLNLAKQLQSLANDYLFDSKIALIVSDDDELGSAIDARIDAAIYRNY